MSTDSWPHLVARFRDVLSARPLDHCERAWVGARLRNPAEVRLFWAQPVPDQRHGYTAAAFVAARYPRRPDLIRAALLHDIGKRHAPLGVVGRSVGSLARKLGLRLGGRIALYLDHGVVGAAELEAAGAEPLVVDYTRHHHGRRPVTVPVDDWSELNRADAARPKAVAPDPPSNTITPP